MKTDKDEQRLVMQVLIEEAIIDPLEKIEHYWNCEEFKEHFIKVKTE